jgi:hypothetical protein
MKGRLAQLGAIAVFVAAAVLFVQGFGRLPLENAGLAIDWKQFWGATHGFQAHYANSGVYSPPWILPVLWPLSFLPLAWGWGLLAFATLIVLLLSVPRHEQRWRWAGGLILLASAYPALRQAVDGNLEALVIGGVLLMLWALPRENTMLLSIGVLLAAVKLQVSWLILLFLGYWLLRNWPRQALLKTGGWLALFAIPALTWRGPQWLEALRAFPYAGSLIDSSLRATLLRLGAPPFVAWIAWTILGGATVWLLVNQPKEPGRLRIGWLASASLLLGPYAASNSVLVPLALGAIPFFQVEPRWGLALIVLYDLPYLALGNPGLRMAWEGSFWTGALLLTWALLALRLDEATEPTQEEAPA